MRVGVVIPCYRQERFLPRTLAALDRALQGRAWRGALVLSEPSRQRRGGAAPPGGSGAARTGRKVPETPEGVPPLSDRWRVLGPPLEHKLTPGAARMLGLAALEADWVLFVDADVELDPDWTVRALERAASDPRLAGLGGRLEEWIRDGAGERRGNPDMYRVGEEERPVPYLATLALYRRDALLEVGGYDARLDSEEDYELGMRFAAAGLELRSLPGPAARHWSGPRPSFAELTRRWRAGLCFGMGQALRLYWGRPGFVELLVRQRLYLAMLGLWTIGAVGLFAALATRDWRPFLGWAHLPALVWLVMSLRKRSPRLGLHSVLTWTVNGLGLMVGFLHPPVRRGVPALSEPR
jgi:glycosyltransferase involved in cell wall biosynthesis